MQVVSNTPLVGVSDPNVVAETFLTQIGYLPRGYDPKTDVSGVRDSVPYRIFMEYLMAYPDRAWSAEELAALLGTTKPTVYRHLNKLRAMDLLESMETDFDGQVRKGYRIRFGDLTKAWAFVESNVSMAMDNYRSTVAHFQGLMSRRRSDGRQVRNGAGQPVRGSPRRGKRDRGDLQRHIRPGRGRGAGVRARRRHPSLLEPCQHRVHGPHGRPSGRRGAA